MLETENFQREILRACTTLMWLLPFRYHASHCFLQQEWTCTTCSVSRSIVMKLDQPPQFRQPRRPQPLSEPTVALERLLKFNRSRLKLSICSYMRLLLFNFVEKTMNLNRFDFAPAG